LRREIDRMAERRTRGPEPTARRRAAVQARTLDDEVGIDLFVAHEADQLASGQLLDTADVGLAWAVPASAQLEDHGLRAP
jgi:hypothetical protein